MSTVSWMLFPATMPCCIGTVNLLPWYSITKLCPTATPCVHTQIVASEVRVNNDQACCRHQASLMLMFSANCTFLILLQNDWGIRPAGVATDLWDYQGD